MDTFTVTLLGGCGTALTGAVAALWFKLGEKEKEYNAMRDKMQDKLDIVTRQAIDAINAASNQMNSAAATLVSIKNLQEKQSDQWQALKEEILKKAGE